VSNARRGGVGGGDEAWDTTRRINISMALTRPAIQLLPDSSITDDNDGRHIEKQRNATITMLGTHNLDNSTADAVRDCGGQYRQYERAISTVLDTDYQRATAGITGNARRHDLTHRCESALHDGDAFGRHGEGPIVRPTAPNNVITTKTGSRVLCDYGDESVGGASLQR